MNADLHLAKFDDGPLDGERRIVSELCSAFPAGMGAYVRVCRDRFRYASVADLLTDLDAISFAFRCTDETLAKLALAIAYGPDHLSREPKRRAADAA